MVSCQNMYDISKRLALCHDNSDEPFGGMNMVLCGDFAQFPPAKARSLYSPDVRLHGSNHTSTEKQECAIGKAMWHQLLGNCLNYTDSICWHGIKSQKH